MLAVGQQVKAVVLADLAIKTFARILERSWELYDNYVLLFMLLNLNEGCSGHFHESLSPCTTVQQ